MNKTKIKSIYIYIYMYIYFVVATNNKKVKAYKINNDTLLQ